MTGKRKGSAYKIIAAAGVALFLLMCLTACGSNGVSDMTDVPDLPETMDVPDIADVTETDETAENIEESVLPEEIIAEPETYEDYIELVNTYLQRDDVQSALAVLDEGIERLSVGETEIELQEVDLLSQRKEYILACTAVVRTKLTERYRDGEDMRDSRIVECDDNGNEVYNICYTESGIDNVTECRYDDDGNQIEYQYQKYDEEGSIVSFTHLTYAYDADGREIEYVYYDENGEIRRKEQSEYDESGNKIKEIRYGSGGRKTGWTEWKYNAAGYPTEYAFYDADGICTEKRFQEYDARGNLLKDVITNYDKKTGQQRKHIYKYEYDENGNIIKDDSSEREYDENGNLTQYIDYYITGAICHRETYEYDERGNQTKHTRYNGENAIEDVWEQEYDESGRETCNRYYHFYNGSSFMESIDQQEYDEWGNLIKAVTTDYDEKTGQQCYQCIKEYEYDKKGNMTKYDIVVYDEETHGYSWEREYNENGRETVFSYEGDAAFYESKTEYDENGLPVSYTGVDENGDILVHKETEYDVSGKVIKESYYDADGNLLRYYENEYDDFGSVTRQAMYEDGILKSEKQLSYTYHYIGDIDTQTMDNQNYDMDSDEYRQRQREILDRFLKGEGKALRCDGVIGNAAVTDLVDFASAQEYEIFPQYIYLDMTGDGIEELLIWEYGRANFYIIQCEYDILKVIGRFNEQHITPVMWNGRGMAIECRVDDGVDIDIGVRETNYFFDGKGKNEVCSRYDYQESEGSETEEVHYWIKDNDSFEEREMSRGEYCDITDATITEIDIDWQKLEAPAYGND